MSGPAAPVLLAGQWRHSLEGPGENGAGANGTGENGSGANGSCTFQADDPDSGEAFGTPYPDQR